MIKRTTATDNVNQEWVRLYSATSHISDKKFTIFMTTDNRNRFFSVRANNREEMRTNNLEDVHAYIENRR